MMKIRKLIVLLGTLALFTGACSWLGMVGVAEEVVPASSVLPFPIDSEITVTGTVTGSIDDCTFDGICALVLNVDGVEVNAIWAEGMLRCEGQYEDGPDVGDVVEVYGIARDANSLSICPDSAYYLRGIG